MFTCEGTIWLENSPGIGLAMWKNKNLKQDGVFFLNSLRIGLKKFFNIQTTRIFSYSVPKDFKTVPLKFYIKRKDSIIKFYKEIGFEHTEKQLKLVNLIRKWGQSRLAR